MMPWPHWQPLAGLGRPDEIRRDGIHARPKDAGPGEEHIGKRPVRWARALGGAASFWGSPEGVTGTRSGIACGSGITKKIFALSRSLEEDFSRMRAVWKCTDYFTELRITGDIQAEAGG